MPSYPKLLVIGGAILVVIAFATAGGIPDQVDKDFSERALRSQANGVFHHEPGFPEAYKSRCATRRFVQNAYIGLTGLVCLAVGLRKVNPNPPV